MPDPNETASPPASPLKGSTGLRRIVNAFFYSLAGLRAAWRHESAFRQEVVLAAVLLPVAFAVPMPGIERAVLAASVFAVLVAELVNSSIEAIVDRVSTERHALAGRAKDLGSAAVLVTLVNLAVTWAFILPDRLLPLL